MGREEHGKMNTPISGGWRLIGVTAVALIPSVFVMCLSVAFDWHRTAEVSVVLMGTLLMLITMTLAYMYVPRWTENLDRWIAGRFTNWL